MDELVSKKNAIESKLSELKSELVDAEYRVDEINRDMRNKAVEYNEGIEELRKMKNECRDKYRKYRELRIYIEEYKKRSIGNSGEYRRLIIRMIEEMNGLVFNYNKMSVFRTFDKLLSINCRGFPNLYLKRCEYLEKIKSIFRHHINRSISMGDKNMGDKKISDNMGNNISNIMGNKNISNNISNSMGDNISISMGNNIPSNILSALPDLVYNMNILVKYEEYFGEFIFMEYLYESIRNKFNYHFMSARETNRLDKPEWMLKWLVDKYNEKEELYEIYKECSRKKQLSGSEGGKGRSTNTLGMGKGGSTEKCTEKCMGTSMGNNMHDNSVPKGPPFTPSAAATRCAPSFATGDSPMVAPYGSSSCAT